MGQILRSGGIRSMQANVTAIIVTYNPDDGELSRLLECISAQVSHIVVVDNATVDPVVADKIRHDVEKLKTPALIRNDTNLGLATAINQGIAAAQRNNSNFVITFDQDSLPQENLVEELLDNFTTLSKTQRVAAVGPRFIDLRNDAQAPFVRIGFPFNHKIFSRPGEQVQCDYLITSGCLIPMNVLREVGGMDDGLFIDNVDMDWSLRATKKGYKLFGIHDAMMLHKIGDLLFRMPMGLGEVMIHSPRRLYYSSRNRVLLYKRPYVSWTWVLQDIPRFMLKFMRLSLFVKPRSANARAMILGMMDGIAGKDGPCRHEF